MDEVKKIHIEMVAVLKIYCDSIETVKKWTKNFNDPNFPILGCATIQETAIRFGYFCSTDFR